LQTWGAHLWLDHIPFAGLVAVAAPAAHAITIPSQDSIKGGAMPKNSSEASQSGFNMEGIKKGGLKPGQKKELLAKLKEESRK
jgi:hypothetical protein